MSNCGHAVTKFKKHSPYGIMFKDVMTTTIVIVVTEIVDSTVRIL